MRHLAISQARDELDAVVEAQETVVLTAEDRPASVVLPYDLYRVLMADSELLRSPRREEVLEAHEKIRRGEASDMQELELEATA